MLNFGSIGLGVIKLVLLLLLLILAGFVVYFVVKTARIKGKTGQPLRAVVLQTSYCKPVDFAKWVVVDFLRGKDYLRLYGIWAFTGYYGQGKTLGCVMYAKHLQAKYPRRDIKIYSNIDVDGQAGKITDWRQMLDLPPNSIMIYDESQSDWSSTIGVSAFPEDFLRRITQVRKRQLAFFMTSPVFHRMNINLRESVNFVIECHNWFGLDRLFSYDFYRTEDYERFEADCPARRKLRLWRQSFVASDDVYALYDTKLEVTSIKGQKGTVLPKQEGINFRAELDKLRNEMIKMVEREAGGIKKQLEGRR